MSIAVPNSPNFLAVGDFNGDGKPDLAMGTAAGVAILPGNGDGSFGAAANYTVGNGAFAVALGDFNGDGKLDVAASCVGTEAAAILLGKGDGTLEPAYFYAAGATPQGLSVGDFNGDGKPDLAVVNQTSHNVSVLINETP
jgi:hypothetical protein